MFFGHHLHWSYCSVLSYFSQLNVLITIVFPDFHGYNLMFSILLSSLIIHGTVGQVYYPSVPNYWSNVYILFFSINLKTFCTKLFVLYIFLCLLCRFIFSSIIIFSFFDWGRCDTRSAFSSVLFQLISFVYNITSDTLYVFCIIYTYLYNLQLCLTCMEMKLMDNKYSWILNLESWNSDHRNDGPGLDWTLGSQMKSTWRLCLSGGGMMDWRKKEWTTFLFWISVLRVHNW